MGFRLNRVTLNKVIFQILPHAYRQRFPITGEDPDAQQIERIYCVCYETVFHRPSFKHQVNRVAQKIADNARRSEMSIRLYILANMLGHQRMEKERIAKAAIAKSTQFTPWKLIDKNALQRAVTYAELCRTEFGAFTLSTLSTLAENPIDSNSLESRMLKSEIVVGQWLVGYKMLKSGPPYDLLYQEVEQDLDPNWLAIEDTYKVCVLDNKSRKGSQDLRSHRFSVIQAITHLKRHQQLAAATFKARQDILPKALEEILQHFGHRTVDFEIENEPITNPLEIYVKLGLAIQHWNLLKYLNSETNIFDRM